MEDFLIALIQGVVEFLLEILFYGPFDWGSRSRTVPEREEVSGRCFWWFLGGCALAAISILFLKHTWIPTSGMRIANLVAAPVLSAFISEAVARRRSRDNSNIIPRNHFWQAFWFTLGMVLVRFEYATRS